MVVACAESYLVVRRLTIEGGPTVDELRVGVAAVHGVNEKRLRIRGTGVEVELTILEEDLSAFAGITPVDGLSALTIGCGDGTLRVAGRYRLRGALTVPFAIEAGVTMAGRGVQLAFRNIRVLGAPIPGFGVAAIGEALNRRLTQALAAAPVPAGLVLTAVAVQPGRVVVSGGGDLDWTPSVPSVAGATHG